MKAEELCATSNELLLQAQKAYAGISYDIERRILYSVQSKNFQIKQRPVSTAPCVFGEWWKIAQVGKTIDEDIENSYSIMQNILRAGFDQDSWIAYYVQCREGICNIYIGLIRNNAGRKTDSFAAFASHIWPGLKLTNESPEFIIGEESQIIALTGIPSIKKQSDKIAPSTIDSFISGILRQDIDYLVIAKPIEEIDLDKSSETIRNFSGALEAIKSIAYSMQLGTTTQNDKMPIDSSDSTKKEIRKHGWKNLIPFNSVFNGPYIEAELAKSMTKASSDSESATASLSKIDKNVEATIKKLDTFAERIDECKGFGAWETGVYLISKDASCDIDVAAAQLMSLVSGKESVLEPIRKFNLSEVVINTNKVSSRDNTIQKFIIPDIKISSYNIKGDEGEAYHSNFGEIFDNISTILSTKELSYYINFPRRSVPGVSVVDCAPDFCLTKPIDNCGMKFGKLIDNGVESSIDYVIPHQCLSRHTLVAGITGSGKTNTIKSILTNNKSNIPFLIIEPAKTEYIDWAIKYNETHKKDPITIFMPGCKTYKNANLSQLKLNPFEIVWLDKEQTPYILSHIDRLKSIFAAAFPMQDILPVLMEELIYAIYQASTTCWIGEKANPIYGQTLFPTLNGMSIAIDNVISNRRYEDKVQMNMAACLHTRVDNLKRGWRGDVLNNPKSTDWEELFEKPCIINLSYVGDETDKAFLTSLILLFMYEYRIAQHDFEQHNNDSKYKTTENDICKHISIVEEAHRVMSKCDDTENPRYKSATLFSNMLSEIRAYGEGMVLVDQVPTRLIPDAIKNTNLKILHRLVSTDDVKALGEAMGLSDEQMKLVPKLKIGDCLVTSSANLEPYWIHATKI